MKRLLGVVIAAAALGLLAAPAGAQLDPGDFDLYQGGDKVGEVFVPARAAGATRYVEHWVLLPGYVYPGCGRAGSTEIRAVPPRYTGTRDFFRRVPFPPGSRYVLIAAQESDTLPSC